MVTIGSVAFETISEALEGLADAIAGMQDAIERIEETLTEMQALIADEEPRALKQRSTPCGGRLNAAIAKLQKRRNVRQYTSATGM